MDLYYCLIFPSFFKQTVDEFRYSLAISTEKFSVRKWECYLITEKWARCDDRESACWKQLYPWHFLHAVKTASSRYTGTSEGGTAGPQGAGTTKRARWTLYWGQWTKALELEVKCMCRDKHPKGRLTRQHVNMEEEELLLSCQPHSSGPDRWSHRRPVGKGRDIFWIPGSMSKDRVELNEFGVENSWLASWYTQSKNTFSFMESKEETDAWGAGGEWALSAS